MDWSVAFHVLADMDVGPKLVRLMFSKGSKGFRHACLCEMQWDEHKSWFLLYFLYTVPWNHKAACTQLPGACCCALGIPSYVTPRSRFPSWAPCLGRWLQGAAWGGPLAKNPASPAALEMSQGTWGPLLEGKQSTWVLVAVRLWVAQFPWCVTRPEEMKAFRSWAGGDSVSPKNVTISAHERGKEP